MVPDLEPLVLKMRFALRKSKYLSNPIDESDAKTINGKHIHESMKSVVQQLQKQRQSDILNVIRFDNFTESFGGKKQE